MTNPSEWTVTVERTDGGIQAVCSDGCGWIEMMAAAEFLLMQARVHGIHAHYAATPVLVDESCDAR